ncbi:hypothetical protein CDD81_8046 [Ophiocordyceps australis]|uniref:FAD-binding domain-containing protein n=1 Tax=Ophiocordyceps australis TaxID=1399860 RepID=A0A2C5Y492_9HYPO|nr:hypothetical protein CDD81_8046 [Ophiocordyceps australis]
MATEGKSMATRDDDNKAAPTAQPPFVAGKTIFIAGAGIAGSALAASIAHLCNPAFPPPTVILFDRDPPHASQQRSGESYTLSLSAYSEAGGLVVLRHLGLLDRVLARAAAGRRADGSDGSFKIWDRDWSERERTPRQAVLGVPTPSLRISRKQLRQVLHELVESWDHGHIEWNTRCVAAERLESGRVRVRLLRQQSSSSSSSSFSPKAEGQQQKAEGQQQKTEGQQQKTEGQQQEAEIQHLDCDLLIAADGANSQLRALFRPNDTLQYTGRVLRLALSRLDAAAAPPSPLHSARDWGFMLSDKDTSCFFSPADDNTILWAVGSKEPSPAPEMQRQCSSSARAVVARAHRLGHGLFAEPFDSLVKATDLDTVMCINARHKKPFCHNDQLLALPIVFIGDSNHAQSPFSGSGANLALADGWDLAQQLCRHATLAEAVACYDGVSEPRAQNVFAAGRAMAGAGASSRWRHWLCMVAMSLRRCVAAPYWFWCLLKRAVE